MKLEERARKDIDKKLKKANWIIQDRSNLNLGAGPGIAIREFSTKVGPVDYALFANRKAIGVIEAKPDFLILLIFMIILFFIYYNSFEIVFFNLLPFFAFIPMFKN